MVKNQGGGSLASVSVQFTSKVKTRESNPASTCCVTLQRIHGCWGRKDSSPLTCSGPPQALGPRRPACLLPRPAWAAKGAGHCLESCDRAMRCTSNVSHVGCDFLAENRNSHQALRLLVELRVIQTTILNAFYRCHLACSSLPGGNKI